MTAGIRSGAPGPPESVSRKRAQIPAKPSKEAWARGLMGEISRVKAKDQELCILLQHMVDIFSDVIDTTWEAIDILDKRFTPFEDTEFEIDSLYTEESRKTQRRTRTVEDDDSDISITVLDVITQEVLLKGNKGTRIKLIFKEPLPV